MGHRQPFASCACRAHGFSDQPLDRAAEAADKGIAVTANGATIRLDPPEWVAFDITNGKPRAEA